MLHLQQTAIGRGNWRAEYVLCPKCGHGYVQPGKRSCPLCRKPYSGKAFVRNAGSFLISHNEAGKTNIVRSVIRKCGNLPLQLPSGNTGMHNVISNKKKQFRKPSTFTSLFEHKCDSF